MELKVSSTTLHPAGRRCPLEDFQYLFIVLNRAMNTACAAPCADLPFPIARLRHLHTSPPRRTRTINNAAKECAEPRDSHSIFLCPSLPVVLRCFLAWPFTTLFIILCLDVQNTRPRGISLWHESAEAEVSAQEGFYLPVVHHRDVRWGAGIER